MRRVAVLGGSGSIGQQALSLIAAFPDSYQLVGLSVHRQLPKIQPWINQLNPAWIAITDEETRRHSHSIFPTQKLIGIEELYEKLATEPIDIVINGIVGAAGFWASWYTLQNPTARLALANKESLVFGGQWLSVYRNRILPIDSEHSALFQCLLGEKVEDVEKLILTASGGPFRGKKSADLSHITPSQALAHPVWRMGARISVDSATLMNKALELIEAYWLFGVPAEQIEVWVHPQCILHSMVLFRDGSFKAQLSYPDMRLPILYALSYPYRAPFTQKRWSPFLEGGTLTFEAVDEETFPTLTYAREALRIGGPAPALLNATDEVAVEAFLQGRISFLDIFRWLEWTLTQPEVRLQPESPHGMEALEKAFREKVQLHFLGKAHAK
ncbi:MAG: 1-deoxy-D-xylulose-5-phosphate reductoisomerase [Bacteroidia bacterium]|nr:1-deoxy-D-xylulose-5-phosphate reductoisomerase [Bacteroidia bacterium]